MISDTEAERWLVNACVTDPWNTFRQVRRRISADDFVDTLTRAMYTALCDLDDSNDPDNQARWYRAVLAAQTDEKPEVVRGAIYDILENPVPTVRSADYYVSLVRQASLRRQLNGLAVRVQGSTKDPTQTTAQARREIEMIELEFATIDVKDEPSVTMQESIRQAERRKEMKDTGVPFPVSSLNDAIVGIEWGEVCCVGARQGEGKSMFAMNTIYAATRNGIPSAIFSMEMPAYLIGKRITASAVDVPGGDWRPFFESRALGFVNDKCDKVADVLIEMRRLNEKHGVRFFAIDYLQLLRAEGTSKTSELENMSISIKREAVALDVAIMVLGQFNRSGDGSLFFKGSSQIEQDADTILILNWPHATDNTQPRNEFRIKIEKARRGLPATRVIECEFLPNRQLLRDRPNDVF